MTADTMPLALAAERAGIHRTTAYRLHAEGKLPFECRRIGGSLKVPVAAFEKWLNGDKQVTG